jgi:HD-GYP domain-containing protein (c-di-GMP phosphodiesterase class II)
MTAAPRSPFLVIRYAPSLEGTELLRSLQALQGVKVTPLAELTQPPADEQLVAVALLSEPAELDPAAVTPGTAVVLLGQDGEEIPDGWLRLHGRTFDAFCRVLATRWPSMAMPLALSRLRQEYDAQSLILDQLTEVSLALSSEHNYRRLLALILSRALLLSGCDAGSLYLVIPEEEGPPQRLLFAAVQNDSLAIPFKETELFISTSSLAGYVASTGETLTIDDSYEIPRSAPYRFNRAYDEEIGYRTKSQLVLPMANQRDEITGVLQLINRKHNPAARLQSPDDVEREVLPFDEASTRLMKTVASLAAVAIDNNRLYENIQKLFEGFVRASVTAIEQRDPTTSGHSFRVAVLTVDLAEAVDRTETGPMGPYGFTAEQLRELRYASLLHDFGKVGVREHVLVKAKKLYPFELERILARLEMARLYAERDALLRKVDLLVRKDQDPAVVEELEATLQAALRDIDRIEEVVLRSNEPTVLPEGDFSALQSIALATFRDRHGSDHPVLLPAEAAVLSIRKGSLSEEERLEIESHVTHTFEFLKKIPWTPELKGVPGIAYGHHEKLNGRGYPRRVSSEAIPIQARMMTVSDIFDALSASDRPYKKAVPPEKALDILKLEVKDGMLDPVLVDLFIEAKVYEKTRGMVGGAPLP